jgi:hypothetical protein
MAFKLIEALFSRPPPRINPSTTPRNDLHPQALTIAPPRQVPDLYPIDAATGKLGLRADGTDQ